MKTINIFGRKMPMLAILIALLVVGTASAAVFTHYGTVEGTHTVQNTISVEGSGIYDDTFDLSVLGEDTFTVKNLASTETSVYLVRSITYDDGTQDGSNAEDVGTLDLIASGYDAGTGILIIPADTEVTVTSTTTLASNAALGDYTFTIHVDPVS